MPCFADGVGGVPGIAADPVSHFDERKRIRSDARWHYLALKVIWFPIFQPIFGGFDFPFPKAGATREKR